MAHSTWRVRPPKLKDYTTEKGLHAHSVSELAPRIGSVPRLEGFHLNSQRRLHYLEAPVHVPMPCIRFWYISPR
jgi:hypothetical protein